MQISGPLGMGLHGDVFVGRLEDHGPDVAIKVHHQRHSFDAELAVLELVHHPNIVSLLDHDASRRWIATTLLKRGTLAQIPEGTDGRTHDVAQQIGMALDHLHGLGFIHGDVTPANIGIAGDRTFALLDFSSSQRSDGSELRSGSDDSPLRTAHRLVDLLSLAELLTGLSPGRGTPDDRHLELTIATARQTIAGGARKAPDLDALADTLRSAIAALGEGSATMTTSSELITGSHQVSKRSRTIEFGPQPPRRQQEGSGSEQQTHACRRFFPGRFPSSSMRTGVAVGAAAAALLIGLIGSTFSVGDDPLDEIERQRVDAAATLAAAGYSWDDPSAVLTHDETVTRWSVGQTGDMAAIADWNCDDTATLGIYRPESDLFYEFERWETDLRSKPPHRLNAEAGPGSGATRLVVALAEDSCAVPELG